MVFLVLFHLDLLLQEMFIQGHKIKKKKRKVI